MPTTIHLVGISGSLRKDSFNTKLLKSVLELLPENVTMEVASISEIPLYNGDLDPPIAPGRPQSVTVLRDILARAQGLVLVSPEYNYSIPGPLKNAIDWASRGTDSPLLRKPVAVMGATPGLWGTIRMQMAFQSVFTFLGMVPVQKPEILIASAQNKFSPDGKLNDEKAKELIREKLEALKDLIIRLEKK